jgi:hypothetical protein
VRGSGSQLLGTSEVDLTVYGIDLLISKAFDVGGTARLEPILGWSMLFISARSGVIDATPGCDAFASPGGPAPTPQCAVSQTPGPNYQNDLNANFTFPKQDVITRQRFFGGFKLKLSVLFVARRSRSRSRAAARTRRRTSARVTAAPPRKVLAVGGLRLLGWEPSKGSQAASKARRPPRDQARRSGGGAADAARAG